MPRKYDPSPLRMQQLMAERGLAPPPSSKEPERAVQLARAQARAIEQQNAPYIPPPELPCPCTAAGHTTGRVKMDTGWCIDGDFYTFGELARLRQYKALVGEGEKANFMMDVLQRLHKPLALDFSQLKVYLSEPA